MEERINVPQKIGWHFAGFSDGEGSFNVSLKKRDDYRLGWKVELSFNVSQKDKVILALFKEYLGCGTLRGRSDGVWYYEVTNIKDLSEKIVPFFEKFGFLSARKKEAFSKFKDILEIVKDGKHLTNKGLREIARLREQINEDNSKRKYNADEVKNSIKESSETIRQAPCESQGDDIVRSP